MHAFKSPHCSVPSGFPPKILYEFSVYPDRAMAQALGLLAPHQVPFQSTWNLSTKWQQDRFFINYFSFSGPGSSVGIATGYGLNGPGIESRWGGEIFRTCPDRPRGPPSLLYNGYRVFPGGKEWLRRDADPSLLLVPWSRKSRAIPLLPLWAVRPVHSLSACTRVHFFFYFTSVLPLSVTSHPWSILTPFLYLPRYVSNLNGYRH